MKKLCSEKDCFKQTDNDDLFLQPDKSYHPLSLKCYDCITDEEKKQLKNYKKRQRKQTNKKNKTRL